MDGSHVPRVSQTATADASPQTRAVALYCGTSGLGNSLSAVHSSHLTVASEAAGRWLAVSCSVAAEQALAVLLSAHLVV